MLEYFSSLNPKDIWNIAQNKPSLIAKDLSRYGIDKAVVHDILLARGVYKWLAVRRKIIKLKNIWRDKIKMLQDQLYLKKKVTRNEYNIGYVRGYLKAYEECRANIRELCHSERWQAPDFDKEAQRHLASREGKNTI